jgi:hypothetical protein
MSTPGVYAHFPPIVVTLEGDVAAALRREARRRDVPAASLARDLIETITTDNLVAAVLDDGTPADPTLTGPSS